MNIIKSNNSAACQSCGSTASKLAFEDSFLRVPVIQCDSCGHAFNFFKNRSEAQDYLDRYYKEEYWRSFRHSRSSNIVEKFFGYTVLNAFTSLRFQFQRAHSQFAYVNLSPANVLEIGAGNGSASLLFADNGWHVTAVEPDENNASFIRSKNPHIDVISSSMESLDIDRVFDLVFSSHVIEHSLDIQGFLGKAAGLMVEGGILFLEVPNADNVDALKHSVTEEPHTNHFTRKSLCNFLRNTGLEILRHDTFYYGSQASLFGQLTRTLMFVVFKRDIYKTCREHEGDVIRILCKKPSLI